MLVVTVRHGAVDRFEVRLDDRTQAAQEFLGFMPPVWVGDAGGGHAEIVLGVGDVGTGELAQPLEVAVDRLQRQVTALAVLTGVVLVWRACGRLGVPSVGKLCGSACTYSRCLVFAGW